MAGIGSKAPEGWIQDPFSRWSLRFHPDQKSWHGNSFVFMDKGRAMPDGSPALLKSRSYLSKTDATEIWKKLILDGWRRVQPQWGLNVDP